MEWYYKCNEGISRFREVISQDLILCKLEFTLEMELLLDNNILLQIVPKNKGEGGEIRGSTTKDTYLQND